ncbi:hypothetical protein BCTU_404 [Buchnera aphidicola (Cinara tujafilina)]|uniref:Ancillary SecYEG translocon subunit/Cell division coordinator CpoB TPR domain-containing protein n=1 Tax=Buchnera aphidicola (Cinara tujafilina) TaxID=261317 RepID=F7WZT3_9GAMM|nr:tetratricopeptide repeat protein [Buchnera aphidicola]AEH39959.1 hypothetical protein BCTU_404 [Buchnera aphidicola (Cinara tujafilina)]
MYKNFKEKFFLYIKKANTIVYFIIFLFIIIVSIMMYKFYVYKKNSQLIESFKNIFNKIKTNKFNSLINMKNFFKKNKNIYGTLIGLNLAKLYDSQKKYPYALKILFNLLTFTKDEILVDLIKLRISILYLKQNKIILAKNMQDSINQEFWKKILNEYQYLY